MNFEYFISSRIIKTSNKGFSKPIVRIAIGGIAVSLMVMFIAIAIVTGFQREVRNKVIGFAGHIQVSEYNSNVSLEGSPITPDSMSLATLDNCPNIISYHPYGIKAGILKTNNELEGIIFKGVDTAYNWEFFTNNLIDGKLPDLSSKKKSAEVLISQTIAKKLKIKVGDKLNAYFIFKQYQKGRAFNVSGIYKTGLEEFDQRYIIGDLRQVQSLNKWDKNQISGIEIYTDKLKKIDEINASIYQNIDYSLTSKSVKQMYPEIFDWLNLQDMNVFIIISIMIIVASMAMISILLILILERTNMIGILKALGMTNSGIQKIFLYQTAYIIGQGLIIGNIIAGILCYLQLQFGIIELNEETYFVSVVPIRVELFDILLLNIGTLIICTLVLIIPSMIIARINPTQAIKFD